MRFLTCVSPTLKQPLSHKEVGGGAEFRTRSRPDIACYLQEGVTRNMANVEDQGPDFPKETAVEIRCLDAFSAVSHFERTHCLALQACFKPLFAVPLWGPRLPERLPCLGAGFL